MQRSNSTAIGLVLPFLALTLVVILVAVMGVQAAAEAKPSYPQGDCQVDTTADSGAGSLRSCLAQLSVGDTITFDPATFPLGSPVTISLSTGLPHVVVDNVTIDGSNAGVILDGSGTPPGTAGLEVNGASGVTIKGLQIVSFPEGGIWLLNGASNNTIGGANATPGGACSGDCNLLSGHGHNGVYIDGTGTSHNTVSGNYIGTDAAGTSAWNNTGSGVWISAGAHSNLIGGDTPTERNVIAANEFGGVSMWGSDTMSNTVSGNYLGTNATGTAALGNASFGVSISLGANNNIVGGDAAGEGNLISGNGSDGVWIADSGTDHNTVIGNCVGLNAGGTAAIPNGGFGVHIRTGARYNVVGGVTASERNVIAGNVECGVGLWSSGTMSNTVSGNYIGLDPTGTTAIPNAAGVLLEAGAGPNLIGGSTPAERNLISGNNGRGVGIGGEGTDGNVVTGNYIGTDATGAIAIPNMGPGVSIDNGASGNRIGGDNATPGGVCSGECNLISGNGDAGVSIRNTGTDNNVVSGNYIGTNAAGSDDLDNLDGVYIADGAQYNTVGGTTAAQRNLISGNGEPGPPPPCYGVWIEFASHNTVIGNYVGTDATGSAGLLNKVGLAIWNGDDNTFADNLVSGNEWAAIWIDGTGNQIQGNRVGTNATGMSPLPNGRGIRVWNEAISTLVGGPDPGDENVIAFNHGTGIQVEGPAARYNTISRNSIHSNDDLGIDLLNGGNESVFPPLFTEVSETSVNGLSMAGATVELFTDNGDEGQWFYGSTVASASGHFTFTPAVPFTGTHVTATATDLQGNTSEFSSPHTPSRDLLVAEIYVPRDRHEAGSPVTPTVRMGNGGTSAETFQVTVAITRTGDGMRVYDVQQLVDNLGVLTFRTLSFPAWTPDQPGIYLFSVAAHTDPADDNPANDRRTRSVTVSSAWVDLWARDNPEDGGQEPSVGMAWQSPDVWVRNAADGLDLPQDPINNITNTVYVRVRNRGTQMAIDPQVTVYWHPPSTVIGQSWWELVDMVDLPDLAPGEVYTASMEWQPQITGLLTDSVHTCLLEVITSTEDPAPAVWDVRASNNLAQRNVEIVPQTVTRLRGPAAVTGVGTSFRVGNPYASEQLVDLVVDASGLPAGSELRLDLGALFDRWQKLGQAGLSGMTIVPGTSQVSLPSGGTGTISGIPLAGEELVEVGALVLGLGVREGSIDVGEWVGGELLGGVTLLVNGGLEVYLPLVLHGFAP